MAVLGWGAGWPGGWPGGWGGGLPGAVVPPAEVLLTWRDERFLTHRFDLWQPDYPIPDGGDPAATTWTRRGVNLPAHVITRSTVDEPTLMALMESENLQTIDEVRFLTGTDLGSSWLCVNHTLEPDGQPTGNWGAVYVVRGAPNRRAAAPGRPCGRIIAYLTRLELVPPGVE